MANLYYWRIDCATVNLGDWLGVPVLEALGVKVDVAKPSSAQPVLFGVGSILHPNHYSLFKDSPITVWGSGLGSLDPFPPNTTVKAVRGPLTRDIHGLPRSTPLGDPSLLLPQLVTLPLQEKTGEILYVNHCSEHPPKNITGCDAGISTKVAPERGLGLVARIAAASFVASESLHGCIVAAAYGVPWSPCSHRWTNQHLSLVSKWTDWFLSLGLTPLVRFPNTLSDSRRWWERVGQYGTIPDLTPLMDSAAELKA